MACRDAVKKAVEALKAASSAASTSSSSAELLVSLSSLQEQLQAVSPETLPAVLEGKCLSILSSEQACCHWSTDLLPYQCPTLTHSCMTMYIFSA